MRRLLIFLATLGYTLIPGMCLSLQAQTAPSTPAPSSPSASCPSTATLDQLIAAIDDAVTGPANKDRTCMKQLLLPEARLIPIGPNGPRILTLDDWTAAIGKNGDEVVTETQIKFRTDNFGHIAHLWSTYTTELAGKPLARGINSIQAVYDGQSWHVIQILWQAENANLAIPPQYLP
jgi:hypothetical protein